MSSYIKAPLAVLDYAFDWTAWLEAGETITAHAITISPAGTLAADSDGEAAGVITAWLSAGTLDTRYTVTCHVTTSAAREDERSITVAVHNR